MCITKKHLFLDRMKIPILKHNFALLAPYPCYAIEERFGGFRPSEDQRALVVVMKSFTAVGERLGLVRDGGGG